MPSPISPRTRPDFTPGLASPVFADLVAAQGAVIASEEPAAVATELRDAYLVRASGAGESMVEIARAPGLSVVEVCRRVKAAQARG